MATNVSQYRIEETICLQQKDARGRIDIRFVLNDLEVLRGKEGKEKVSRAIYECMKSSLRKSIENDTNEPSTKNTLRTKEQLKEASDKFKQESISIDTEIREQAKKINIHCTISCLDIFRQHYIDTWHKCIENKKFSHRLLRNLKMDKKDSHLLLFTAMKVTFSNSNTVDQDVDHSAAYGQYQNYLKRKQKLKHDINDDINQDEAKDDENENDNENDNENQTQMQNETKTDDSKDDDTADAQNNAQNNAKNKGDKIKT